MLGNKIKQKTYQENKRKQKTTTKNKMGVDSS